MYCLLKGSIEALYWTGIDYISNYRLIPTKHSLDEVLFKAFGSPLIYLILTLNSSHKIKVGTSPFSKTGVDTFFHHHQLVVQNSSRKIVPVVAQAQSYLLVPHSTFYSVYLKSKSFKKRGKRQVDLTKKIIIISRVNLCKDPRTSIITHEKITVASW